jgi:hypothetical protein
MCVVIAHFDCESDVCLSFPALHPSILGLEHFLPIQGVFHCYLEPSWCGQIQVQTSHHMLNILGMIGKIKI